VKLRRVVARQSTPTLNVSRCTTAGRTHRLAATARETLLDAVVEQAADQAQYWRHRVARSENCIQHRLASRLQLSLVGLEAAAHFESLRVDLRNARRNRCLAAYPVWVSASPFAATFQHRQLADTRTSMQVGLRQTLATGSPSVASK